MAIAVDPVVSHTCRIPGCERPAKDRQLMCWPHWRRVPRALNRAIFDTYANGPRAAYLANVEEAVRVIQQKEAEEGSGDISHEEAIKIACSRMEF